MKKTWGFDLGTASVGFAVVEHDEESHEGKIITPQLGAAQSPPCPPPVQEAQVAQAASARRTCRCGPAAGIGTRAEAAPYRILQHEK
jgi:hypothetical protein